MEANDTTGATQPAKQWTRYTEQDVIDTLAVLAEQGGNVAAASRIKGIPEQTIRQWRDGRVSVPPPHLVEQRKQQRALVWDQVQDMALEQVMARIGDASARDAAVVAGIAVDKAGQNRGEATQVIEHRDDERTARLRELYAKRAPIVVQPHTTTALPAPQAEQAAEPKQE